MHDLPLPAAVWERLAGANRRALVIDPYRFAVAGFDPLSIGWTHAVWAEDPDWTPPADGAAVSSWRNAGSNGTALTEGTGSAQPIYRASFAGLNSKPAVECTGTQTIRTTAGGVLSQPVTIVAVGKFTSTAGRTLVSGTFGNPMRVATATNTWRLYEGGATIDGGTADTNEHLFIVTYDGASSQYEIDGAVAHSGNPGTTGMEGLTLFSTEAASPGTQNTGVLAFVGVLDGTLTSGEKADLLAWSQSHYGTP